MISVLNFFGCFVGIQFQSKPVVIVFCALFGITSFPTLTSMIEFVARDFAAIPYSITNAITFVSGQSGLVAIQILMGKILESYPDIGGSLCLLIILYLLTSILVFLKNIDDKPE
jgi:hypothetical protein